MSRRPHFRRITAAVPLWVLAGMLVGSAWSRADEPRPPHRRMENRFLFVIDTSSAMQSRTNGVEAAVTGLLASGMKGELRKGDTIGLWTYSDRLSTDFPMQVWSEDNRDGILDAVREHLHILVYEKRAHLDRAWPAIHQVVADSERLTIVLITDGNHDIKGTPFDKQINYLHNQHAREFRSARDPFVTVLASRDGVIFDFTDNHPDSIVIPHTADPLPPPEPIEPPPVVATLPEIATPSAPRLQINLSGSDFPHHDTTPPAASLVVTPVTPAPAPAPVAVTEAPAPVPAPPIVAQAAQTVPAVKTTVPPPQVAPSPVAAPAVEPAPAPVPAPAPAPAPAPLPSASTPTPASIAPMVPAAAKPVPGTLAPVAMFIIAFSLLIIAVALVVLLVWRWRGRSQSSLITRSIDRSR